MSGSGHHDRAGRLVGHHEGGHESIHRKDVGKLEWAGSKGQEPAMNAPGSRVTTPVVEVSLGSKRLWALVDSGADFSMIRSGLHIPVREEMGCQEQRR